jgi:hypothetical protein
MKSLNTIIGKTILFIVAIALSSCATTQTTQQLQPVSEGQIIDVGDSYSVKAPRGEGWGAQVKKEMGAVDLIRVKNRALGILGGGNVIGVSMNLISPERWYQSEEEVADDYRNREEQDMFERGVRTGAFKLEDVKKGITTIDSRKLYFMSYRTTPGQQYIAQEAILYLYFLPDFKKKHIFFVFIISEFLERFSPTKPDLTQIYPVINSLQIVDPLTSLTGINGEFIRAAADGNITAVKDLIVKGVDVNAESPKGSALMLAAYWGHIEVVKLLIDKGADVNRKTGNEDYDTALLGSILGGETEIVKLLIEKGSAINAKNNRGNTALMLAAFMDNAEIAKLLIEKGADVNAKNQTGNTALKTAKRLEHGDIVKLFEEAGAKE